MSTVTVIMQNSTDDYSGRSWFRAVAANDEMARQWIQDEVDHKHDNGNSYAQGHTAEWWITYGMFTLKSEEVFDRIDVIRFAYLAKSHTTGRWSVVASQCEGRDTVYYDEIYTFQNGWSETKVVPLD